MGTLAYWGREAQRASPILEDPAGQGKELACYLPGNADALKGVIY